MRKNFLLVLSVFIFSNVLAKDEDLRCAFSKKSMTIRDELEMNRIIEKWHLLIENSFGGKK